MFWCRSLKTNVPVTRCLFETFFTLDCEAEKKRAILESLVAVARRAAPDQELTSLGGPLIRKVSEARDEGGATGAAFFASLVPPTVSMRTRRRRCFPLMPVTFRRPLRATVDQGRRSSKTISPDFVTDNITREGKGKHFRSPGSEPWGRGTCHVCPRYLSDKSSQRPQRKLSSE